MARTKAMDQNHILYALLTDASEDCTPFWEAVWEVTGRRGDHADSVWFSSAVPEAQRLLGLLLSYGLVGVCRGRDYRSGHGSDGEAEVSAGEAAAVVADPASWPDPSDGEVGVYFCFYATPTGKHLWYRGRSDFGLPAQAPELPSSEAAPGGSCSL